MTDEEKLAMVESLRAGQKELLEALSGVTEQDATRSPGAGRWSVMECVEHIAVVEEHLFGQLLASEAVAAPVVNERREALIPKRGMNRDFKVEAPEAARPAGRFPNVAAAVAQFGECRDRTIKYVEECRDDQRARMTTHPILGPVNCWETLLMMAMHPRRHAGQIREIRAALAE